MLPVAETCIPRLQAATPCLASPVRTDKHLSIGKLWCVQQMMMACEVERWSGHEEPSSSRRFTGANQWAIESRTTLWEEKKRGGEDAVVVQHVRVIRGRLLNFGSHTVVVYGYLSVVKRKAVRHFAFISFFVVFVSVERVENVKLVTWSSIKQIVLCLYSSLLETELWCSWIMRKKVQVILRN